MTARKHFLPLESNPAVFTELAHRLGLSSSLAFHDVLSLDDAELLAFVPRPALALVLVFPASRAYQADLARKDKDTPEHTLCGDEEDAVWFKQTIHNACGLYGILHALSNGAARGFVAPDSHLSRLLSRASPLKGADRAAVLEEDEDLESLHREVALKGDSAVPASAEDEVDFHYLCFVKSDKSGHLYELDGDRRGPIDHGELNAAEDVLSEKVLGIIKGLVEEADSVGFGLLALAPSE